MGSVRRLLLKSVTTAVILGGNCFVCEMTTLTALAAERPAPTPVRICDEKSGTTGEPADVMAPPSPSESSAVSSRRFPVPACPMTDRSVSHGTVGPVGSGLTENKPFAAGLRPVAVVSRLAAPAFQDSLVVFGPSGNSDRTPLLTGTVVKNE